MAARKIAKKKIPKRKTVKRKTGAGELFTISSGRLGPLGPCDIEVKPLTVFIGRQGTGKSLVAQMLYFFRGLPPLVNFDVASRRPKEKESAPEKIVRRIVDGMRSSHRSFARLTVPNVRLRWQGTLAAGGAHGKPRNFTLNVQSKTSQVLASKPLRELVKELRDDAASARLTAVFVPTERLLYAMALGPTSLRVMSAPLILETFSQTMELAGRIQSDWEDGVPDTEGGKWVREHLRGPLAGEGRIRGSSWRWTFEGAEGGSRQIDLDMASSGQRANWPLSLIPQVLFSMRARGELSDAFTLYVEEPEIHLHPEAERAVIEVLAYLVKNGIRVVLTTHSLTVLYTINNLLVASQLGARDFPEVPNEIRLRPDDVAAYHFAGDGSVEELVGATGTIDEQALGSVSDELSMQMNRILAKKGPSSA